jgi:ferredoxin
MADQEKCIGSGSCVVSCPEVFALNDDGVVTILEPDPHERLRDRLEEAIELCPAACIWSE